MTVPDAFYDLAEAYNINHSKPRFPVNTMRLFYLMFARDLTQNNTTAMDAVNEVVPRISAYLDAGDLLLSRHTYSSLTVDNVREGHATARQRILDIVQTVSLPHILEVAWEQERFLERCRRLKAYDQHRYISLREQFWDLLDMRAMDSFVYARVVGVIIHEHRVEKSVQVFHPLRDSQAVFDETIRLILQMNDITDAICYAKQDLASNSATLLDLVIQQVASPVAAITFYRQAVAELRQKIQQLALSSPAREHVYQYGCLLEKVLEGQPFV